MRDHPISPVTEPLQYRAIGVVRGIYRPESDDQLTRGVLIDSEGNELEAVVLGRMLTLMRRHLDMTTPHLWVVYPRCRDSDHLHLQIAGIWEPSTLATVEPANAEAVDVEASEASEATGSLDQLSEGDDFFSIRGELIFTKPEANELVVKVRQLPRADGFRPLPFKVQLTGELPLEHLRHFVSLDVRRQGQLLSVEAFEVIAPMPTRGGKGREGSRNGGAGPRPAKT
ncbi:MAG: hypothetical protein QNK79_07960 [Synechococcus sp. ArSW.bin.68]|jgi:hypothetical protein